MKIGQTVTIIPSIALIKMGLEELEGCGGIVSAVSSGTCTVVMNEAFRDKHTYYIPRNAISEI